MLYELYISSLILDNERWKQADVPAEFQTLVDSLVDGTYIYYALYFVTRILKGRENEGAEIVHVRS